jgi:hypothetical protein
VHAFLFELGIQLVELLKIRLSSFGWGRHGSPRPMTTHRGRVGRRNDVPLLRGPRTALISWGGSINLKVESLSGWIVVVSIGVRVTKAIITCLKEPHESLFVTKAREVSVGPCILTRGKFLRIGGCGWGGNEIKGRPQVVS